MFCLKPFTDFFSFSLIDCRAVPRLLHTLIICLQSNQQKSRHPQQSTDIVEDITKRLLTVLKSFLELVDNKLNVMSSSCELSQSG